MDVKKTVNIIIASILLLSLVCNGVCYLQYQQIVRDSGKRIDELAKQCSEAEDTNKRLAEQLDDSTKQCSELERQIASSNDLLNNLADTVDGNADTIQKCLNIVRAVRKTLQDYEKNIDNSSSNKSSDRVDNRASD